MQEHLKHLIEFTTAIEGIELECLMHYFPSEWYDERLVEHACSCEYALLSGADIFPLLSASVIGIIEERYLDQTKKEAESARTERRIENES